MYSNNSTNVGGAGTSGCGSNGAGGNSKKRKRESKGPQRGLGVAELELLLREQQIAKNLGGYNSLKYPQFTATSPFNGGSDTVLYGKVPELSLGNPALALSHDHPLLKDIFRQSGSLSSSNNLSAGYFQPLEHPLNQTSYENFNHVLPQLDKIAGTKRPWLSSNPPPFDNQVPAPLWHLQIPHQPTSFGNHNAFNLPPGEKFVRNTNENMTNHGGLNGNFDIFGSSKTAQLGISTHNLLSRQFDSNLMESNQTSRLSGSSDDKNSFHRSEGRMCEVDLTLSLSIKRDETRAEESSDIDLSLKL